MASRNKIVGVRFALTEYRDLCAAAEAAGTSPSAYLRECYERLRAVDEELQAMADMEARMERVIRSVARVQLGAVLHYVGGKSPGEAREIATKMTANQVAPEHKRL